MGRILIVIGAVLLIAGLILTFFPSLKLGRLPGDLSFGSKNARVFIPITTSIILSLILSAILWLVSNLRK